MDSCIDSGGYGLVCSTRMMTKNRCQKHWLLYKYGWCSRRHFNGGVLATGPDGLCGSHRNNINHKTVLAIGDVNDHGIAIVDGPQKMDNLWKWGVVCPLCEAIYWVPTSSFPKARSCYDCRGILRRKSSNDRTWRQLWGTVKGRRRARELGFDITLEQFIEISSRTCYYCGAPPTPSKGSREWAAYVYSNGLDRVDSSKGYLLNNVVPACKRCNMAKSDMTQEEFFEWIRKVSEKFPK